MLGLIAKYNWQFRRPYVFLSERLKRLDVWRKVAHVDADTVAWMCGAPAMFRVGMDELRETWIWHLDDVDWKALEAAPSSMVVPSNKGSWVPWSAIGGTWHLQWHCRYYLRRVLAITFPALCLLLAEEHTAEQIEAYWLQMPLVTVGKPNRGNAWKNNTNNNNAKQKTQINRKRKH